MRNILNTCLLVLFLLLLQVALAAQSGAILKGNLPKTKELKKPSSKNVEKLDLNKKDSKESNKKSKGDKESKNESEEEKSASAADEEEAGDSEEKEKFDPAQDYKLIAVYLINKQPRALIKNLTTPEEAAKEYQVGDYLDELGTLSISKISFNPTTRVEFIDQDGLSYLIKPNSNDDKTAVSGAKGSYGNKAFPSHFSTGGTKPKIKKASESTATPSQAPPSSPQEKGSVEAAVKEEIDTSTKPTSQATNASQTQKPQAETTSPPSQQTGGGLQAVTTTSSQTGTSAPQKEGSSKTESPSKGPSPSLDSGLGVDRPKNPFGD